MVLLFRGCVAESIVFFSGDPNDEMCHLAVMYTHERVSNKSQICMEPLSSAGRTEQM